MGIYGNLLDSFPELFRPVTFWDKQIQIGSGYELVNEHVYSVIIITEAHGKIEDRKVTDYKVLDLGDSDVLYTPPDVPVKETMLLRHPDSGDIYVVDEPYDYTFTGGFKKWNIVQVQGANGLNQGEIRLKEGVY